MRRSSRSGFTLIEIMIVVGIIAILVVVLVAVLFGAMKKGEIAKAEDFVTNVIPTAITKWQNDTMKDSNTYPASPGLSDGPGYWQGNASLYEELVTKPVAAGKDPYVKPEQYNEGTEGGKKVFLDPWMRYYIYRNYSQKRSASGKTPSFTGKRYNENTYDIISLGPDGELYEFKGDTDDIYNGRD
ncbi:MAG: prepilin-type N-terminal cleavage/methylation domain-containing protein [Planctomycetes bacterium]|nr:prepilin-type N-terminal cleavage/methylation domain-containing protein [Planctomycetota bacterium]MCB9935136.1 prepilin-type N-terminal cleavage/methylation domain-containing protein [Planctomycetota bacterium]